MKLQPQSNNLKDYLVEIPPYIQFNTPLVSKIINEIKAKAETDEERAKLAFEIARDNIQHSFDSKSDIITIGAEETLEYKEGICFAKSHLLATLLRGLGIPSGFCYQRVLRDGKTIESGHALHGLNAVYLNGIGWFRVDPRGNKAGINSQFRYDEEQLAYPIRIELGEVDYPQIYTKPLKSVLESMESSKDCSALFYNRPDAV